MAYECLTGQVPFPREGQLAIMTAHLTAPPPSASAARPGLPAAVDAVLARAMAKDPAARYPTCTQFVAALAAALPAPRRTQPSSRPRTRWRSGSGPGTTWYARRGTRSTLALRFGWGDGPAPVVALLVAEPLAIRGDAGPTAALVRWLLAQAWPATRPATSAWPPRWRRPRTRVGSG